MNRLAVTILILLFGTFQLASSQFGILAEIKDVAKEWIKFKQNHLKQFSLEEDMLRFDIFKENLKRIDNFRKKLLNGEISFKVGITQFADLTKAEFANKFLTLKRPQGKFKRELPRLRRITRQAPHQFDWRNLGAVTPVKDQGNCSSCWAFSAVGALEGQYFRKFGNSVPLSEQNLIDCSTTTPNHGCNGGWPATAFQDLMSSSIATQNEYPYIGSKQNCQLKTNDARVSVKEYISVNPDEQSLQEAVASIGPISAALDATNLQFYVGGVYRDDECTPGVVNHGVLIIGYGSEQGRDYWLVKNSWGSDWGDQGYFKIERNKGNLCNIASYGVYPVLN